MDNPLGSNSKPTVLLIASQMPQQELGLIAQLLQSQGFARQQPADPKGAPELVFATADNTNRVAIKFYQDIGALRLELNGDVAIKIGQALAQYMDPLTAERIGEYFQKSTSDMERRIYAILLVLTYPNATDAMKAITKTYFDEANDATREGVVQGLAFLETPDVGTQLEILERNYKDTPIAKLCRKAIDGLSDRGVIRESIPSFMKKIEQIVDDNPKAALEAIEKYEAQGDAPEIRALHAKALRLLGKTDEAAKLLEQISLADPDAAAAFCQRALLREAQGFAQNALQDAQTATAIDPTNACANDVFTRLSLVVANDSASQGDKRAQLDKLIDADPDDPNLRIQRAELSIDDAPQNAIDDLKTAQKSAPNDPRLPLLLAKAYLGIHHLGAALEQASIAQKTHTPSQQIDALLIKPRVFLAIDDPKSALDAIHEIPAEFRENPPIVLCTAIIFELLGRTDEANAYYKTHKSNIATLFATVAPTLYTDLPLLRTALGVAALDIRPKPNHPLDQEPIDPLFKRCRRCGALSIKRRTQCRDCGSTEFFEN